MKKLIYLILCMAVASSALAGIKVNPVPKRPMQQVSKVGEIPITPVTAGHLNTPTTQINAPKITPKQRNALPALRVLERSTQPTSFKAPVTNQPEGTVSYYRRSGKATFNALNETGDGFVTAYGNQSGIETVVENGDEIYFKNLLYDPEGFYPDYWIHGTKNGSTITISLPQDIDDVTYEAYGVTIQLFWGTSRVLNGQISWLKGTNSSAYFDIASDGTLSLRNGKSLSINYGSGLCAAYSYNGQYYYDYSTIYNTTLTPIEDYVEPPVMYSDEDIDLLSGEFVTYYRTGYSWNRIIEDDQVFIDMVEQSGFSFIFYDDDGETVYLRDPVYGWQNNMWIKGTWDGNVLTFPLGQYVYWNEDSNLGLRTCWGTLETDAMTGELSFTEETDVTDMTFYVDYDGSLTMDNCGLNEDMTMFVGLSLMIDSAYIDQGWFGPLDFFTQLYDIPSTPTNVNVTPSSTTADVTWTDDVNSMWNIRYREHVDGNNAYINNFDNEANLNDLTGWDLDGDGEWWGIRSLDDGTYCLTSASWTKAAGAIMPDNWLAFPGIHLNGVVSIDAWGQDPDWASEVFKVYIYVGDINDVEDPATSFIPISGDITVNGDITTYTFNIPDEYQGQLGAVAIRHYNVTDMFMLNIDNLYVGDPDQVPQWTIVNGLEQLEAHIEGLTPETTYELQVQSINPGGVSEWGEAIVFTTLADQVVITRGDVNDDGVVDLNDVVALNDALLTGDYELINYDNAAICDSTDGDDSETVDAKDLTALFRYILNEIWPDR